jgi:hypothetical protein
MIQSKVSSKIEWETTSCPPCFEQPFFYLGHGAQSFAFVSADGKYVLKFYRHNRARHPLIFLAPLLPVPLKKSLLATHAKRQNKRQKDFSSYLLAYHHLAKETGLLGLHLNPSPVGKVKLYDKIGVEHIVDLGQMQFIFQKQAEPTYAAIEKWISQGKIEYAKEQLSQMITLLKARCQKGIFDKDPDLKTNFGFTDEGPIQFDIGRFKYDPKMADSNHCRDELIRITDRLCKWLETKMPALSIHIQEEIHKV